MMGRMWAISGLLGLGTLVTGVVLAVDRSTADAPVQTAAPEGGSCGASKGHPASAAEPTAPASFDAQPAMGTLAYCTVMDQVFAVSDATAFSEHDGRHYAFCCEGCKARFDDNPAQFAMRSPAPGERVR
jgi:YHS domain-containing protein